MKNISKSAFLALEFKMPTLPEQTAIAEVLSDMDAELAALEQRHEKTRVLKQGMMQELLTGRTRGRHRKRNLKHGKRSKTVTLHSGNST